MPSQKKRCADYAKERGHIIEQSFGDEGISGGTKDRP
ncbi:MAG: recombinase family protein [Lactobacillales bacterium]|nr:recombinase family protein [Lactobacillales bacterium]